MLIHKKLCDREAYWEMAESYSKLSMAGICSPVILQKKQNDMYFFPNKDDENSCRKNRCNIKNTVHAKLA